MFIITDDNDFNLNNNYNNDYNSDDNSVELNKDSFVVKRIKANTNRPRINSGIYMGAFAFDVIWKDGTETREPIQNLICTETKTINEDIIDTIYDHIITARNFPFNNRRCMMCFHKVYNGATMCSKHSSIYYFLND